MTRNVFRVFATILLFSCMQHSFSQASKVSGSDMSCIHFSDSAKIDCFNSLSESLINNEKKDSAEYFANLALSEGKRINYNYGISSSLLLKAQIAKHFYDDFIGSEKWCREALNYYDSSRNK